MKNLFKASMIGGLIAFIWSLASWTLLPWHTDAFETFKDEKAVAAVLEQNAPRRGIYIIPRYIVEQAPQKAKVQDVANEGGSPLPPAISAPEDLHPPMSIPDETQAKKEGQVNDELLAFCSIVPVGHPVKSYKRVVEAFVVQIVSAFFVALIVTMAKIRNYFLNILYTGFLGLIAGIIVFLPMINWFGFSWEFCVINTLDLGATWLLAGIVMSIWTKAKKKNHQHIHTGGL